MHLNNLVKTLSLAFFSTTILAKDTCRTLSKYYGGKEDNTIVDCSANENGEITYLNFNGFDLKEDDYDRIFSYTTINNLVYEEDYNDCHSINGRLNKLSDLRYLTIQSYKGTIEKGVFKGLNKLEKLTLQYAYLSNDNIKEIIALSNLKELSFYNMEYESDISFSLFKKANNVQTFTIEGNLENSITSGLIKNLKNVKTLKIKSIRITQSVFNEITTLSNLKELSFTIFNAKNEFKVTDFSSVKNLTGLTSLVFNSDLNEIPEFIYDIPNLKKLTFNSREIKLN